MFSWWMNRPLDGTHSQDGNAEIDAPETPAPVFAARALKSAIFGTPARPDDETMFEIENEEEAEAKAARRFKPFQSGTLSPTKPQGILLTPGTATSRRKTVSFGHEVVDKVEEAANETGVAKSVGRGRRHSASESRQDQQPKLNRLTKALEEAREGKNGRNAERTAQKGRNSSESNSLPDLDSRTSDKERSNRRSSRGTARSQKSNQELMQELASGEKLNGDMTIDLNDPRSQSGRYWKSEFEQYHTDAHAEMEKLSKYRDLAKSYAKKKDAEAIELAEKLKEEQRRVVSMEDKISMLSTQIASMGLDGQGDESPELIKELARQTALAVQYRAQVEEFREALEGNEEYSNTPKSGKRVTSPRTEQTLIDTHRELKKARGQLKEMFAVREEIRSLKQNLAAAETASKKLQEENTKLAQDLLHADLRQEQESEKSEKRRQILQERMQKKDEDFQSLQNDYNTIKEAAKSQRREAEHLLKKRHDQVVDLKKQIASLKGAESTSKELQQTLQTRSKEHEQIITDYQRQIARLISTQSEDIDAVTLPTKAAIAQLSQTARTAQTNIELPHLRDSQIPVLSHSVARPSKVLATTRQSRSETAVPALQPRSSHTALSEITNGASSERLPLHTSQSVQFTPAINRSADLSMDVPDVDLPSPELSMLSQAHGRAVHERNCYASSRPSMFVIPSSPPKPAVMRTRTSGELARQRSINALANASSRLSSLEGSRARISLPPERVAAAKARLEQKNAEKKRAQAMGADKENVRK